MALFSYQQQTQLLLSDVTQEKFNPADLTTYINLGRSQIAAEGKCIRGIATLNTTAGTYSYSYSAFSTPTGTASVLTVRMIRLSINNGAVMLASRSWEWFNQYYLSAASPASGPPTAWAQLGQGVSGTINVNPNPDQTYALGADAVFLPIPLVDDTTVEAIPYPWTDAIPYYAAYKALIALPDEKMRKAGGDMWDQYGEFMARARRGATPTVLPGQFQSSGVAQPATVSRQAGG